MVDLIVVGNALPGLLSAAYALKYGAKVIVISNPGPHPSAPDFPLFTWSHGDIWHHVWRDIHLNPLDGWMTCTEGQASASWLFNEHALTFQNTANVSACLGAHNATLPHAFYTTLARLKSLYLQDMAYLRYEYWPTFKSQCLPQHLIKQYNHRYHGSDPSLFRSLPLIHPLSLILGYRDCSHVVASQLYSLCHPKRYQTQRGSASIIEWLLKAIDAHPCGKVLNTTYVTEVLFDHREVKGVVCDFPYGIQKSKLLLINTSFENCHHMIPNQFHSALNAHAHSFSEPHWLPSYGHLLTLSLSEQAQYHFYSPILVTTQDLSHQIWTGCALKQNDQWMLYSEFPPPPSTLTRLSRKGITVEHTLPPQTSRFHNHGMTDIPNVRFSITKESCLQGMIGQLMSGLELAQWVLSQRRVVSKQPTIPSFHS